MIDVVPIAQGNSLEDYASFAHLAGAVHDLRREAKMLVPALHDRKLWMVNSTARGGGVAEMLPRMVALLRELGVDVDWVTITPHDEAFFGLTKKLHNLIHGVGEGVFSEDELELYGEVSRRLAAEMQPRLSDQDILIVHDPQPAGMGALLETERPSLVTIWRCHIGLDVDVPQTRAAWTMLEPHVSPFDHAVFSAAEYIPPYMTGKSTVIAPAIDPLTAKNRPLSAHQLAGVLVNAGLMQGFGPVVRPDFEHKAQRLRADGSFTTACEGDDIGLLFRPIVTQVSRWDRLKGFKPLLDAFVLLKRGRATFPGLTPEQRHRLDLVRLVLAGPDPASIQDDPEGRAVLEELKTSYVALDPEIQDDVALLSLPMGDLRQNALMVNALQHCSSIVVQNSLREGFGLTMTEAMWKRTPVLGSTACGLRQQVRDNLDGKLNAMPEDPLAIATLLVDMLGDTRARDLWSRSAQRRVHDEFLIFAQLRKWLRLLGRVRGGTVAPGSRPPRA